MADRLHIHKNYCKTSALTLVDAQSEESSALFEKTGMNHRMNE
jgi:hypothetical protein